MGEYAQVIAAGRATALSAAQEMLHTKRGNENENDTTAKTTAQLRQNSPSDWALGAYGSTFVLAPSFSLRLGAEDSLLLRAAIQHEGLAVLLQSELSGRPELTRLYDLGFGAAVVPGLTEHAHRVWTDENAGGSSRNSEAMSMELLSRAFGAILHKTEMQLRYFPSNSSITDMSISLAGVELGVSVTRAMHGPSGGHRFGPEEAEALLRKKLRGVLLATEACYNASFRKQLLHVWAATRGIARRLEAAHARLEPELIADTVVLITTCQGMPEIFDEKAPPAPLQRKRALKGAKDEQHLRILRESNPLGQAERACSQAELTCSLRS